MSTQIPSFVDAGKIKAVGYVTPKEDRSPQTARIPPRRAIPIVFLPGIMGSNLRMSAERQRRIGKSNNIAWRPDRKLEMLALLNASPADRQLQLDPISTEVDTYDDGHAPSGDSSETAAQRHSCGSIHVTIHSADALLLEDDPPTVRPSRTKEEKALGRGWGEVYFTSYRHILEICEQQLNRPNLFGGSWGQIVDVDPMTWGAVPSPSVTPLTEGELKEATKNCIFPVHAMGYNWLQPIEKSASLLATRINKLIEKYRKCGVQCEKVIVVTHSMGGLVGRALVHPNMGNVEDKILGIVHGVQPALGAPSAYKRMRCGFEEGFLGAAPTPKILGNHGAEVTCVLGNSVGGLQLLPSCAYGNGWLQIQHEGRVIERLPKNGDPYAEIYCLRDKWYRLLREEWLNPADGRKAGFEASCELLKIAKKFHLDIEHTYHRQSYAHYGADTARPSWETVTWKYELPVLAHDWNELQIESDNGQGHFSVTQQSQVGQDLTSGITIKLAPAAGAGDQTVPVRSSDHQLLFGKFKGVFRQTGYEHQESYSNTKAIRATLYSIIRIAASMKWPEK